MNRGRRGKCCMWPYQHLCHRIPMRVAQRPHQRTSEEDIIIDPQRTSLEDFYAAKNLRRLPTLALHYHWRTTPYLHINQKNICLGEKVFVLLHLEIQSRMFGQSTINRLITGVLYSLLGRFPSLKIVSREL